MKKTLIYMAACCLCVLTTAMTCSEEDDYYNNEATRSGKLAYDYLKKNINKHTDILALAYHFNKYAQQEDERGRDSIDNIFFRNVKIHTEKDPADGTKNYLIRNISSHYNVPEYTIYVSENNFLHPLNADGDEWNIHATVVSDYKETTYCYYHITVSGKNQWKIESHSIPRCMLYFVCQPQGSSKYGEDTGEYGDYTDSFACYNDEWTINWNDKPSFAEGEITAAGQMESFNEPKMKMNYQTKKPLNVFYVDCNYSVTPPAMLYGLQLWENKMYPFLTFWNRGSMDIRIEDSIDNTTDDMEISIFDNHINMQYMGKNETWHYW